MSSDPKLDHLTDEALQSYLDGQLRETEAGWAAAHLRICVACQERAAVLEGVFQALGGLPEIRLQRDLAPGVLSRIRPASDAAGRWRWLLAAQGLAAGLLAAWVGRSAALEWIGLASARLQTPPSWLVEILAWSKAGGETLWAEAQAWVGFGGDALSRLPEFSWARGQSASPALFAGLLVLWLAGNSLLLIPGVGRAGQTS
jgi:hypothetical protein